MAQLKHDIIDKLESERKYILRLLHTYGGKTSSQIKSLIHQEKALSKKIKALKGKNTMPKTKKNKKYLLIPLKKRNQTKTQKRKVPAIKTNREMIIVNSSKRRKYKEISLPNRSKNQSETIVKVLGEIPGQIESIEYERTGKHPGDYQHVFDSPSKMFALSDGSILISPEDEDINLWLEGNPKKKTKARRK